MKHEKLINITDEEIGAIYDSGKENTVAFIRSLIDKINEIDQIVKKQQLEIDHLKAIVAKDSHNSSKPPSSDGFKDTPKPKSQRKKGKKSVGGQKGHKGSTLKQTATPDKTILCKVTSCTHCHADLQNQERLSIERRQVVDIQIKTIFTEYQSEVKECNCGAITKGNFPENVTSPIQYGDSVRSMCNYLSAYQLLPYKRLQELFTDIFDLPVSTGTLVSMNMGLGKKLNNWRDKIKNILLIQKVLHFDETGFRLFGKRYWLHSVSSATLTFYQFHKNRGTKAMDDNGILPNYTGSAIHDFWKPYLKYKHVAHILCNTHHLRELIFLYEQYNQIWAEEMIVLLLDIKRKRDSSDQKGFLASELKKFNERYERILKRGFAANPVQSSNSQPRKRGRPKKGKVLNLLLRFREYKESILAFMNDWDIPFDNNQAERDLRMMKVQQKISGTFRSIACIEMFCLARSYISTAKKNNKNILDAISAALAGDPFMPCLVGAE